MSDVNMQDAKAPDIEWLGDLTKNANPEAQAIIDHDGVVFTYAALNGMVAKMIGILTEHGVRPGDRLMVVSENCATYAVAVLAAFKMKAWVSPINARQSAEELLSLREHSGARCIVFTPEASVASADHAKRLGARSLGNLACGKILVTEIFEAAPAPLDDDPKDQVAALMYTTGTTSAPKGVMLTHGNLIWNGSQSAILREMKAGDVVLGVLGLYYGQRRVGIVPKCQVCGKPTETQFRLCHKCFIESLDNPALRNIAVGAQFYGKKWRKSVDKLK